MWVPEPDAPFDYEPQHLCDRLILRSDNALVPPFAKWPW